MTTETLTEDKPTPDTPTDERGAILARIWRPFAATGRWLKRFGTRYGVWFLGISVVLTAGGLGLGMWEASFQPSFCNACHIIRPYVSSYQTSSFLDNTHREAGTGCKECHHVTPLKAVNEVVSYVTGDYQDPLSEHDFAKENCLECHRSYQSLIEQTAHLEPNPHDSHLGELECTMCHNSHRESTLFCNECHTWELTIE